MGVQSRPDSRASQGQLAKVGYRLVDVDQTVVEKLDPAGNLLSQGERRRVHQMCAADLDQVSERLGLLCQRRAQLTHCRYQTIAERRHGGHVHGRRKHIVR